MKRSYINNQPLYTRLSDWIIRDAMQNGAAHGDRLPGIRKLASMYKVSEAPVRQALELLKKEDKVESRPGSGVYLRISKNNTTDHKSNVDAEAHEEDIYSVMGHFPFVSQCSSKISISLVDASSIQKKMWNKLAEAYRQNYPGTEIEFTFDSWSKSASNIIPDRMDDIIQTNYRFLDRKDFMERIDPLDSDLIDFLNLPTRYTGGALINKRQYGVPLYVTYPFTLINRNILKKLKVDLDNENFNKESLDELMNRFEGAVSTGTLSSKTYFGASFLPPFYLFKGLVGASGKSSPGKNMDWSAPPVKFFFSSISRWGRLSHGMPSFEKQKTIRNVKELFLSGELLAFFMVTSLRGMMGRHLPDFAQILPFPFSKDGRTFSSMDYFVLNSDGKNKKESKRFLKFLYSDEARIIVLDHGYYHVSGRKSGETPDKTLWKIEEIADRRVKSDNCWDREVENFVCEIFNPVFFKVCEGGLNPEKAIEILKRKQDERLSETS